MDTAILLAFPLLLALFTSCDACKCKLPHPQTVYCGSDVVMFGHILADGGTFRNKRIFKVNITKVFRGPKKADEIHEIYTPLSHIDCGYRLSGANKRNLLIAGFLTAGRIYFTKCHIAIKFVRLSLEQRLGLETYYRKGCDCQVQPCLLCWDDCPEPDVKDCVWKQRDCQYTYYEGDQTMTDMCFPSKTGQCQWTTIPINGSDLIPR